VDGGFWGIVAAIQTPGAPTLRVVRTTTNTVVLAWQAPATGFSLQQNAAINNAAAWGGVSNVSSNIIGSEIQVIISPPVGNRFYRLKSP